jgi:hypothetical protein
MKRSTFIPVLYEDRITIPTPEGVSLELALAGFGSRTVAGTLDPGLEAEQLDRALRPRVGGADEQDPERFLEILYDTKRARD